MGSCLRYMFALVVLLGCLLICSGGCCLGLGGLMVVCLLDWYGRCDLVCGRYVCFASVGYFACLVSAGCCSLFGLVVYCCILNVVFCREFVFWVLIVVVWICFARC